MFEVARCFHRANQSDFVEYSDDNFIIDNNRLARIIRITKGHSGLVLFEGRIADLTSVIKDDNITYFDFDIKKLQNPIQDYTDEELILILGRKYTDDYIFDVIDYNHIKKKVILDKIKEFNSNV